MKRTYHYIPVWILAFIAIVVVLQLTRSVVLPLIIAVLVSFIVNPIIAFIEKFKVPRIVSTILILLIFFGFFYLVGIFLFASINEFAKEIPKYAGKVNLLVNDLANSLELRFQVPQTVFTDFDWQSTLRSSIAAVSNSSLEFLRALVVVTLFLIFILLERPYFKSKIERAFNLETSLHIENIMDHVMHQIGHYLSVKLVISLSTGFLVWLTASFVNLDFAFLWGVLAVLLNFIPNIGSIFITLLIVMMSVLQFYPNPGPILYIAIVNTAIQMIIGNIIDPRLQGHRLDLSPLLILIALFFFSLIWGIVGMFISVPILVLVRIVCQNIPQLKFISVLMDHGNPHRSHKKTTEGKTEEVKKP
jgi:AI-2 transport protein TqsA